MNRVISRSDLQMRTLKTNQHQDSLVRRRIKFVVEKGAMARLFRAGTHGKLKEKIFECVKPVDLCAIQTREDYDHWLMRIVESNCWRNCSRNGLVEDRWAYFAKLINIVVYEIVSNRELCQEAVWERLKWFLHLPVDGVVLNHLNTLKPGFPAPSKLKGMTKLEYLQIQSAARELAVHLGDPPIWFEDAWSGPE